LPGLTIEGHVPVGDAIYNVLVKKQYVRASRNVVDTQWQDAALSASLSYFDTLEAKARVGIEREMEGISAKYQRELHEAVAVGIAFKGLELIVQTETVRYGIAVRLWLQHQRDASAKLSYVLDMDAAVELVPEDADLMPIMLYDVQTPLESLMQQAYSTRPELKEMQDLIAAARADRNGAIYGPIIPTLSTNMFFGSLESGWERFYGENSVSEIEHQGQPMWHQYPAGTNQGGTNDILFGVNWRIGPGGLGDIGKIRQTNARLETAQLRWKKMLDDVNRQVVQNHTRIRSYYDQVKMARANVKTAREVLRLVTGRQEFGIDRVLEVIKAEQGLEQAYNDYVIALAEFNKSQYKLSRAVGGLLPLNSRWR
ncbi:MAG: TolC family protein, partial [Desulfomonilaceae bacterium]